MSETLTPQEAAQLAEGQEPEGPPTPEQPETAEFDTDEGSRFGTIAEAALSTEPSIPLEQVESMWNPEQGGETRVSRGIQKATNINGIPAALDIAIGVIEMWVERAREAEEGGEQQGQVALPTEEA